jgi:uncharacterized membrane protein YebE (DUF533 family)
MFDAKKLLDQMLGGQQGGSQNGASGGGIGGMSPDFMKGLASGGVAGSLATILLGSKSGTKLAKSALKVGGTAALAGLAYKAYQTWQQNQQGQQGQVPAPASVSEPVFLPPQAAAQADLSLALLRAMIAAAKADGHIDAAEQQKIFGKLDEAGLGLEAKAFVIDEMRKPLNIDAIVADATTPERAIELYTASVLAIDVDDPSEQAYLAMLAARLKLDPGLKLAVEQEAAKAMA